MTNRVDLSQYPRDFLTLFGSCITKPSDIVRVRGTSRLFRDVVAVEAARAFFQNQHRAITAWGFLPTSDNHYENFKTLFLFIKHRYGQAEFEEAVRAGDFSELDKFNVVSLERIDRTFVRAQTFYDVYKMKLAGILFPILARQNRTFRVMAEPRADEDETALYKRLWKWLRVEKETKSQLTEVVHRNPDEPVPRHQCLNVIPCQITYFTHLQKLDLCGHKLTFVPSFLSMLKHLKTLTLRRNQIANVSCRFDQMPALRWIDLRSNFLAQLPSPAFFNKNGIVLLCVDGRAFSCDSDNLNDYPSVLFVVDLMSLVRGGTTLLERVVHHNIAVIKRGVKKGLDDSSPLKPVESECIEMAKSADYLRSRGMMISLQMQLNSDVD